MTNLHQALDGLTFGVDLDDDELISDAVILARVTRMSDGRMSFLLAGSQGLDTVTRAGLLECGRQVDAGEWANVTDAEEEE